MARRLGGFNTQPPEGGCCLGIVQGNDLAFQHTAARRRLETITLTLRYRGVSTHSRPKAAAKNAGKTKSPKSFQHTAARRRLYRAAAAISKGGRFNTQPPEGGWLQSSGRLLIVDVSTHSRPKAAGHRLVPSVLTYLFQHTAARRRLPFPAPSRPG